MHQSPETRSLQADAHRKHIPGPRVVPQWMTPFVGRERELSEAAGVLTSDEVRLLTLTGPGGVGKTRVALQLAGLTDAAFPGGIWFVPLSHISNGQAVAVAIARTLGVHRRATPPEEAVTEVLRKTRGLLILDNFEHIVSAAPLVTRLLMSCPDLKVLVTSRVRLNISGEHTLPVPPLALPSHGVDASPEEISATDAVRFFLQCARRGSGPIPLTAKSAEVIAEICRMLDGLPLAIELAAPWLRVLSPQMLLTRLHNRLSLLGPGPQDAPSRQHTMRSTIDWSYVLLPADGQVLLRRLSVFTGGFPVDAIEQVTGIRAPEASLLSQLGLLIDHSLVGRMPSMSDSDHDVPRFTLMETIREYAFEQLMLAGEADNMRERHAEWCLAMADTAARDRITGRRTCRGEALVAERHNMRAALDWLDRRGAIALTLRLATTLWPLWLEHGEMTEGRAQLTRLLERSLGAQDQADQARAKVVLGLLMQAQGEINGAEATLGEVLPTLDSLGDAHYVAAACTGLGLVAMVRGDTHAATSMLERALAAFQSVSDIRAGSWALRHLSSVAYRQGKIDECERHAHEGLLIIGADASPLDLARLGSNLGLVAMQRGHLADAMARFKEVLAQYREADDQWGEADALQRMGYLAFLYDERDRAVELYSRSIKLFHRIGDPEGISRVLCGQAWLDRRMDNLQCAARRFDESAEVARHHDAARSLAEALLGKGAVALDTGSLLTAAAAWQESLAIAAELNDPLLLVDGLEWIVRLVPASHLTVVAFLTGEIRRLRESTGIAMARLFASEYERFVSNLRHQIGNPAFEAAVASAPHHSAMDAVQIANTILDCVVDNHCGCTNDVRGPSLAGTLQHELTRREGEVLRLLAEGLSNRAIAETLSISQRTVGNHVLHILTKLDLDSRTAAAAYAIRHGLA